MVRKGARAHIYVGDELMARVRAGARKAGIGVSAFVRRAIEFYLEVEPGISAVNAVRREVEGLLGVVSGARQQLGDVGHEGGAAAGRRDAGPGASHADQGLEGDREFAANLVASVMEE